MNKRYTLDMSEIESFDDFVSECNEEFIESVGGNWGGNLDAFNDYLSWPEPIPYDLVIIGTSRCEQVLGYGAAEKRLRGNLKTCHPLNRERVKKEILDARNGKGQTLWDIIVEIFNENTEWVNVIYR